MATTRPFALALTLALLAGAARAEDCVECSSCLTPNCFKYCKPTCVKEAPRPSQVSVPLDQCVAKGAGKGYAAADAACRAAIVYCNRGRQQALGAANAAEWAASITAGQCSNVAMGACQRAATERSPCADMMAKGYGACDAAAFTAQWKKQADSRCFAAAQLMTDVAPGSGADEWASAAAAAGRPGQQQQQQQAEAGSSGAEGLPTQSVPASGMSKIVLEIREEDEMTPPATPGAVKWSPRRLMAGAAAQQLQRRVISVAAPAGARAAPALVFLQ